MCCCVGWVEPKIIRRGQPHGNGLGRVRWVVVEGTFTMAEGMRQMQVRDDRSTAIRDTWTSLTASISFFRILSDEASLAV